MIRRNKFLSTSFIIHNIILLYIKHSRSCNNSRLDGIKGKYIYKQTLKRYKQNMLCVIKYHCTWFVYWIFFFRIIFAFVFLFKYSVQFRLSPARLSDCFFYLRVNSARVARGVNRFGRIKYQNARSGNRDANAFDEWIELFSAVFLLAFEIYFKINTRFLPKTRETKTIY